MVSVDKTFFILIVSFEGLRGLDTFTDCQNTHIVRWFAFFLQTKFNIIGLTFTCNNTGAKTHNNTSGDSRT